MSMDLMPSVGFSANSDASSYTGYSRVKGDHAAIAGQADNANQSQAANQAASLDLNANQLMQGSGRTSEGRFDRNECQSCKNRKYQDGSDDPGVSFKTPTAIGSGNAANAVMSHEQEHVTRNAQKAKSEGREVISSSVRLYNSVCPECGKVYVAGGETRTVTGERQKSDDAQNAVDSRFAVGEQQGGESGKLLNAVA